MLGGGEHRRDDHDAGVHRAALERVVVVFTVSAGAIAKRRSGNVEATRVADHGARAFLRGRAQRSAQILSISRRHAQAANIDQHPIAHRRDGDRKVRRRAEEGRHEPFRDGNLRERHSKLPLRSAAVRSRMY